MPAIAPADLKALILDVDGTLYSHGPVRRHMLVRLLRSCLREPTTGLRTLRALSAYRRAQEHLRRRPPDGGKLAQHQLDLASEWTGLPSQVIATCVARWMERESLPFVAGAMCTGLLDCLHFARERGMRLGIVSDYPPGAKLAVMGIAGLFAVTISAQDPDVQRFKPDPRGLEVAIQRLGVAKSEALYVGNRPAVDAVAASRAGIACVIIGQRTAMTGAGCLGISDYAELRDAIGR